MSESLTAESPVVVFVGPTVTIAHAQEILDAVYLPPASQGSMIVAVKQIRPRAVVLIDGVFQVEPAVRHNEIIWTLSQGIPVIGAASMGALRAAELWRFGMTGVGLIFRWYRRFRFAPDDAVAVLHGDAAVNPAPLTIARIDLRITFRNAQRAGAITEMQRLALCGAARRVHYRDLSLMRVAREASTGSPAQFPMTAAQLESALRTYLISQKKLDAIAALRMVKTAPLQVANPPLFTWTATFQRDVSMLKMDVDRLRLRMVN
jgi:hypothetical protein